MAAVTTAVVVVAAVMTAVVAVAAAAASDGITCCAWCRVVWHVVALIQRTLSNINGTMSRGPYCPRNMLTP